MITTDTNSCVDLIYDIATILISIADITTDVIVLISFYVEGRITFFIISLIILIIAQMAYSILFIIRYEIISNFWTTVATFFILLPFGTVVSFLIYFTEDTSSWISIQMDKMSIINVNNAFGRHYVDSNQSKMTQWIIRKGSKHIGFIIEAGIEALPQSLLQIIAIVYYKEAHYVSIVSIFLSMISVMTKSLIFSQGIDIKTYIWTWLCIVTDFFGIFFTLTWVFYSNEAPFQPQFLNHFSIIGQIWIYKVLISVAPFVFVVSCCFTIYHLPEPLHDLWTDSSVSFCGKCGWTLFIVITGALFVSIASAIGFLALEILCFAFLALIVYVFGTDRWCNYQQKDTNDNMNAIINFVSKPSICNCTGDRMLRILAVNVIIPKFLTNYNFETCGTYITNVDTLHGLKGLKKITYGNIRNNCGEERYNRDAKVFPGLWFTIKEQQPSQVDYDKCLHCTGGSWQSQFERIMFVIGYWLLFVFFPAFVFCKVLQAVFPYIILGYVLYHRQLMSVDLFQLVMLITYIGLQFVLLILGVMVCRIHWWLWHIYPGRSWLTLERRSVQHLMQPIDRWYEAKAKIPTIRKCVMNLFGQDISQIIMDYYENIQLE
eukprot:144893_1